MSAPKTRPTQNSPYGILRTLRCPIEGISSPAFALRSSFLTPIKSQMTTPGWLVLLTEELGEELSLIVLEYSAPLHFLVNDQVAVHLYAATLGFWNTSPTSFVRHYYDTLLAEAQTVQEENSIRERYLFYYGPRRVRQRPISLYYKLEDRMTKRSK